MYHRNYGQTKNCKGCRYWSEMIAMSHDDGVQAMCLAPNGAPRQQKYTNGLYTCVSWASGYDGPVDEPGNDPLRYTKVGD